MLKRWRSDYIEQSGVQKYISINQPYGSQNR